VVKGFFRRFTLITVVMLIASTPTAQEAQKPPQDHPKVVLVLSGGGARGIAHVGVLRVLEELHIAPDLIVATSMGSIVGGMYAAGWSPDEIEELVISIDWEGIFTDRVPRKDRSFRRKQDDRPVMIDGRLHFDGLKPIVPSGVIHGQKLELMLSTIEALSATSTDFDRLPIPFRAVAADIATGGTVVISATGGTVVISSGSLAKAMRASMSVPGALPPVELDGRELVDGGIAANLPVGIAKNLGAEHIIAVDISSPLLTEDEKLGSFIQIYQHLNSLLTVSNRDRDVALLGPGDLLIEPDLGDISFISFDRVQEAAAIGEEAARRSTDELRRFAASDQRWADFSARPRARPHEEMTIESVRIDNTSHVGDRLVRDALTLELPDVFDAETLIPALLELYSTRYFGRIGFQIEESEDSKELVVATPPPPRGRGSLQFGVAFFDDFSGDNGYSLKVRHQLLPVNRRGGEWETLFQIGTVGGVASEFYQPLDWKMRWFVAPSVEYRRGTQRIWFEGTAFAEYEFRTVNARLAAGRVLGKWGELRVSAFTSDVRGAPRRRHLELPHRHRGFGGLPALWHRRRYLLHRLVRYAGGGDRVREGLGLGLLRPQLRRVHARPLPRVRRKPRAGGELLRPLLHRRFRPSLRTRPEGAVRREGCARESGGLPPPVEPRPRRNERRTLRRRQHRGGKRLLRGRAAHLGQSAERVERLRRRRHLHRACIYRLRPLRGRPGPNVLLDRSHVLARRELLAISC